MAPNKIWGSNRLKSWSRPFSNLNQIYCITSCKQPTSKTENKAFSGLILFLTLRIPSNPALRSLGWLSLVDFCTKVHNQIPGIFSHWNSCSQHFPEFQYWPGDQIEHFPCHLRFSSTPPYFGSWISFSLWTKVISLTYWNVVSPKSFSESSWVQKSLDPALINACG